jgi:hypothetical protein
MDVGWPMVIWIDYDPQSIEPQYRQHNFNYTDFPKRSG